MLITLEWTHPNNHIKLIISKGNLFSNKVTFTGSGVRTLTHRFGGHSHLKAEANGNFFLFPQDGFLCLALAVLELTL